MHSARPSSFSKRLMDYFAITVATFAELVFSASLFIRFRRWAGRNLALSLRATI